MTDIVERLRSNELLPVCPQAVIAYEPFKTHLEKEVYDGMMSYADALEVDKQC